MNLLELQSDPAAFQRDVCIATGSGPRKFGDVMAEFQRERFTAVNPSLVAVAKHEPPPIPRVFDERTKGASKDTDWSVNLLWLLAFSRRALRMQVGAFDQQQADEVRLIVKDILRTDGPVNQFLRQVVEVRGDEIVNPRTGSTIEILTADKFGSHGSRIDLLLLNELTHQPQSGFAETLFDNLDKMPRAVGVIATNCGHLGTWQEQWKAVAKSSPRWKVLEWNRPAPWISADALAESEKRNPPSRYRRLWWGEWTNADELDPALSPQDIEAAFVPQLRPMTGAEPGWLFVAGIDLGLTRDHSAVVVLAVPQGGKAGRVRLANVTAWRPPPGGKIILGEVEEHVLAMDAKFGLEAVGYDPWQAEHLAQRAEALTAHRRRSQRQRFGSKPWMREVPPTAANLREQASLVIQAFQDRRLMLYPHERLRSDLLRLRTEEKSYGVRLIAPRGPDGHADVFSAFAYALLLGNEFAGKKPVIAGAVGPLTDATGKKLSKRELAAHRHRRAAEAAMQQHAEIASWSAADERGATIDEITQALGQLPGGMAEQGGFFELR